MISNDLYKKIPKKQVWNKKEIRFDPDSSPLAWKHYKKYYQNSFKDYDFDNLYFFKFTGFNSPYIDTNTDDKYFYKNKEDNSNNRLFIIKKDSYINKDNSVYYFSTDLRLGGDVDFNFNNQKLKLYKEIINNDKYLLNKLDECSKMHHTVVNFSLMQSVGNLQKVKGSDKFDRFDVLIYKLNKYYEKDSTEVLNEASYANKPYLIKFLLEFYDIYDYMEKVHFINDKLFVDKIIFQGSLSLNNKDDVERYLNLALEVWKIKTDFFLNS